MEDSAISRREPDAAKAATRRRRSWLVPRFSLRTILILITLVCLAMGLPYSRSERQRVAVETLRSLDCHCEFEPEPKWLAKLPPVVRNFRGGHYFRSVVAVTVNSHARSSLDAIFEAIGKIDRVESIYCLDAPVTHEHLARLSHLRNVKNLRIHHALIDDGALADLRNWTRLEELLIPGAGVTGQGVAYLKRNSGLRRLDLSGTLVGDEIAEVLSAFPRLEGLEFWQTDLTGAGFARFPDFAEVKWVDMDGTQVDDEVVKKLARFPKLTGVDLSETRITDFTGRTLAQWPLHDIRLSETAVTDATLNALTETSTLENLDIRRTPTTLFGVRRLHALPNIKTVSYLDKGDFHKSELRGLAGKRAGRFHGIEISKPLSRAEWEVIAKYPVQDYLVLEGSNCDDEILELLAAHTEVRHINVRGCAIGARGMAALAKLRKLEYINLADTPVTTADFAVFRDHPHLAGLTIRGTKLGDDALATILSLDELRGMAVARGQFSYESLKTLCEWRKNVNIDDRTLVWAEPGDHFGDQHFLKVPREWPLTRERRQAIVADSDVQRLHLDEHSITDEIWAEFAPLDQLTQIALRGRGVTDKTLEQLATRQPVYWLSLTDCGITGAGLKELVKLPSLQYLHLQDMELTDADLECLDQMTGLQGLSLDGTKVSDASLARIARLTNLRYLRLDRTKVSPLAARAALMPTALGAEPMIFPSRIENLVIGGTTLTTASLAFLRNGRWTATSLDLNGPCFDDEVLVNLADYVWLRDVELTNTAAGDATLKAMSGLTDLQKIGLKGTKVTDDGLRHMANWKHLRWLDLSNTAITDEGLKHVLALPQLRTLELKGTRVSSGAIEALRAKYPWVRITHD